MRFPVPHPRDAVLLAERAAAVLEQAAGLLPRMLSLVDEAERVLGRIAAMADSVELTRESAASVVRRADEVVESGDVLVSRLNLLLADVEPPLRALRPTLDRLAATTGPQEVDALTALLDRLPSLAGRIEEEAMPLVERLATVAPDLHELLASSRELNEIIGHVPGMGRIKRKVDEEQNDDEPG